MNIQSTGGAGQAELRGINALPLEHTCTVLLPATTVLFYHSSIEKRLQNIKNLCVSPLWCRCFECGWTQCDLWEGRRGGLGGFEALEPPSKKVLWCWPSWSTGSPNGWMWGCMKNTSFHHSRPFPRCSACSGSGKPQLNVWGVCLLCFRPLSVYSSQGFFYLKNNPAPQLLQGLVLRAAFSACSLARW